MYRFIAKLGLATIPHHQLQVAHSLPTRQLTLYNVSTLATHKDGRSANRVDGIAAKLHNTKPHAPEPPVFRAAKTPDLLDDGKGHTQLKICLPKERSQVRILSGAPFFPISSLTAALPESCKQIGLGQSQPTLEQDWSFKLLPCCSDWWSRFGRQFWCHNWRSDRRCPH